jgi:hypothetical protein
LYVWHQRLVPGQLSRSLLDPVLPELERPQPAVRVEAE